MCFCVLKASQVVLVVKNLPANVGDARDMGLIPAWGRSCEIGNGNQLPYSHLENFMGRGAWRATVHEVAKSQAWLSVHICARTHTETHTHTHTHFFLVVGEEFRTLNFGKSRPAYIFPWLSFFSTTSASCSGSALIGCMMQSHWKVYWWQQGPEASEVMHMEILWSLFSG